MRAVIRLGLTGGIGSGKSTVASMFMSAGAAVVDADAISRQATAAGGTAIEAIRAQFGPEFITAQGALDRDKMRAAAFAHPDARKRLEAIVHPLVGLETARQAQAAIDAGSRCIVFDIPLLVESTHWRGKVDLVLVVDCTSKVQIERIVQRSAMTRGVVEQIMASQASRATRLKAADLVIFNADLSLQALALEVGQLAQRFGL
jgi:dephospho-CoA kinase